MRFYPLAQYPKWHRRDPAPFVSPNPLAAGHHDKMRAPPLLLRSEPYGVPLNGVVPQPSDTAGGQAGLLLGDRAGGGVRGACHCAIPYDGI